VFTDKAISRLRHWSRVTIKVRHDEMLRTLQSQEMTPELVTAAICGITADAVEQVLKAFEELRDEMNSVTVFRD
jgi:hypothetical protein